MIDAATDLRRASCRTLVAGCVLLLTACAYSQPQAEEAAVIEDPSATDRAALRSVVARLLGVSDVVLAEDALTNSATLLIEHGNATDAGGRQLDGRNLQRPAEFRLLKSGNRCVLLRVSDGERVELEGVHCRAL